MCSDDVTEERAANVIINPSVLYEEVCVFIQQIITHNLLLYVCQCYNMRTICGDGIHL